MKASALNSIVLDNIPDRIQTDLCLIAIQATKKAAMRQHDGKSPIGQKGYRYYTSDGNKTQDDSA